MLNVTPTSPRYAVLVAKRHLRGVRTLDQRRQLARWTLKLVYAADPGGLETRHDVRVLRRWLDLLNAADRVARLQRGTWHTARVTPSATAAITAASDAFGLHPLALRLRACSDEALLYERLVVSAELGSRGKALWAVVEAECAARPWLLSEAGV